MLVCLFGMRSDDVRCVSHGANMKHQHPTGSRASLVHLALFKPSGRSAWIYSNEIKSSLRLFVPQPRLLNQSKTGATGQMNEPGQKMRQAHLGLPALRWPLVDIIPRHRPTATQKNITNSGTHVLRIHGWYVVPLESMFVDSGPSLLNRTFMYV